MKNTIHRFIPFVLIAVSFSIGMLAVQGHVAAAEHDASTGADPMQFSRGAQTWANNCARCHNMRDARTLRDDQWRVAMAHMRVRANLTGQEARDVLVFLQGSN
jgi:cytochrome c1